MTHVVFYLSADGTVHHTLPCNLDWLYRRVRSHEARHATFTRLPDKQGFTLRVFGSGKHLGLLEVAWRFETVYLGVEPFFDKVRPYLESHACTVYAAPETLPNYEDGFP